MATYEVERVEGQAGYEKALWTETIEAESAAKAIELTRHGDEFWPIEAKDDHFASASDPDVGSRFSRAIIATLAEAEAERVAEAVGDPIA